MNRITVQPDTDLLSIAHLMIRENVPSVAIEENGVVKGEVNYRDVLRVFVKVLEERESQAPSKTFTEIAYNSPVALLLRELSNSGI